MTKLQPWTFPAKYIHHGKLKKLCDSVYGVNKYDLKVRNAPNFLLAELYLHFARNGMLQTGLPIQW